MHECLGRDQCEFFETERCDFLSPYKKFLVTSYSQFWNFYSFRRMFEWGSEKCKYPGLNEHKQICCSYLRCGLLFSYSCYSFTAWFHWKILTLELWKMQPWSLSKQKTMSTLLMTITKSWIQILRCYALDCRRQWPDTMSESFQSAAQFSSQFPMALLWVGDTG